MPPYEVLKSEKNRDVLLVDGYLFWFDRATPRGRKYWKCIYCYRSHEGDVKNRCISRVITSPGDPVAMVCKGHNHERDTMLVEQMFSKLCTTESKRENLKKN
ncbi:hypothetical protein FO519_007363 [Halicephalobus sp. NKZ332]|nr:hypothetical protein FO519_007363 [Halicephalobus sp. NKZ332]